MIGAAAVDVGRWIRRMTRIGKGVAVRKTDLTAIMATLVVAASAFSVVARALSAVPSQGAAPRTPRPAHERLAVLEGTWTKKDLPAGESFRDTCAWLPEGRRHMICVQRAESPRRASEQMAIFSYRGADSTYLLTVLLANGQVWRYEGRPDADRCTIDAPDARRSTRPTSRGACNPTRGRDSVRSRRRCSPFRRSNIRLQPTGGRDRIGHTKGPESAARG